MPRAMISSAAAIPLLVLLIGAAGLFAGMGIDIVIWALITRHLLCRPRLRRAARRAHRRRRHRRCCHAAQLPDRAFRQRARLDLLRLAGLRRLPGRSVHRHQGRRDAAGHRRDGADHLVAARRADRHLRAAGRRLRLCRHQAVGDGRGDHGRPADPVAAVLFLRRRPSQQIGADAAVVPHREGRADRRARDGQVDVGRGAPPRRGGQSRQVALPRLDEPRAADAAQRHPRLLRGDGQRGAGADGQPDLSRLCPATCTIPGSTCST